MSIARKLMLISVAVLFLMVSLFSAVYFFSSQNVDRTGEQIIEKLKENDTNMIKDQIASLGKNTAQYIINIEDEIDRTMRNAALLLQKEALDGNINVADLQRIAKKTGMNDLYLTKKDGIFYLTTEKAAMGVSLFGIWDGYRMLIDGKATELPSPIKVKVETGEIFKFTAIQKLNKEGAVTGIVQVALDASKSIQTMLQNQIDQNSQLEAVNIIEQTGLVLTGNVSQGGTLPFKVGETVTDAEILSVSKSNTPLLRWDNENSKIFYFQPIQRFGGPAYILMLMIDPQIYLKNTNFVQSQFVDLNNLYHKNTLFIVTISVLLLMTVIVTFTLFVHRGLLRPIQELSGIMLDISEGHGDLTQKITIAKRDEIGLLAKRFNLFVDKIKAIVIEAKYAANSINEGSGNVASNLESAYRSIQDISVKIRQMNDNIANQAEHAIDCGHLSGELSHDISFLTEQMQETTATVTKIVSAKEDGEEKMGVLVKKTGQSLESNRNIEQTITGLSQQIANINQIVDDIKTIAKQTQLLSLNASIEASRAGEHGLGFAVVAGEVNKLADQAAHSAAEIAAIIATIEQKSAESVQSAASVLKIAREQSDVVAEVNLIFSNITGLIEQMHVYLENANRSVTTVDRNKAEMADNIRSVAETGEENRRSAHEVSAYVESQVDIMKSIQKLSGETSTTATSLSSTLSRFKVEK